MSTNQGDMPPAEMRLAEGDMPAQEKGVLAVGLERHARLVALMDGGAEALSDAEAVHDVRVAARRLGEVARMMRQIMDKPTNRAVKESLKSVRKALGEVRDGDVMRQHLEKWKMPAAVKQVAHAAAEEIEKKRAGLVKAAAELMATAGVQGALVVLARVIEEQRLPPTKEEAEGDVEETIREQVKRREKQLRRAFGRAAMKQTAESLHAARIAVKKLRYLLELADAGKVELGAGRSKGSKAGGGGGGGGLKKRLKFLKGLQALLGDHHDVHVILEMLAERAAAGKEKRVKPAWSKWKGQMDRAQSKRAVEFLLRSHEWMSA